MDRFYYTVYDPNSQALALREFEDNLIAEFITKIRATNNEHHLRLLFDAVWYAIDELSEYSSSDHVERLQKYVSNEFSQRLIQLYTPQEYYLLITIRLSNPTAIRRDLQRALNTPSSPLRSLEVSFLEHLLNLIQNRENMPARNLVTPYEEAMFGKCWEGYKKVGMKNKSGRRVPNCVRK
jgi:hypothetical protein